MGTQAAATLLEPIFIALPLDVAMPELLPASRPNEGEGSYEDPRQAAREELVRVHDLLSGTPELQAAMWLYVDDLDRSHAISQGIETPLGSYLHAIMHRREGDFSNSKYWLRRAGMVPDGLGFDPFRFVDAVESDQGVNAPVLVEQQRREWSAVHQMCVGAQP